MPTFCERQGGAKAFSGMSPLSEDASFLLLRDQLRVIDTRILMLLDGQTNLDEGQRRLECNVSAIQECLRSHGEKNSNGSGVVRRSARRTSTGSVHFEDEVRVGLSKFRSSQTSHDFAQQASFSTLPSVSTVGPKRNSLLGDMCMGDADSVGRSRVCRSSDSPVDIRMSCEGSESTYAASHACDSTNRVSFMGDATQFTFRTHTELVEAMNSSALSSPCRRPTQSAFNHQVMNMRASTGDFRNHAKPEFRSNPRFKIGCILPPTSRIRMMFDCMTSLVTVYDLALTPYLLAWDITLQGGWKSVATGCVMYWTLDMFVSCRSGFWVRGDLVMDARRIMKHYLQTWFVPDLLLVIVDWVGVFWSDSDSAGGLSILRLYKLVKLTKIFRLRQLIQVLKRCMDRSTSDIMDTYLQVFQVIFSTLWSNHMLACLWYAIGKRAPADTGDRWLDLSQPCMGKTFSEGTRLYQYSSAFHWGMQMMTMGAMDVYPTNSVERLFSSICLVFGLIFFSSMISMFNAKLMSSVAERQDRSNQISQVRQVLARFDTAVETATAVQQQVYQRMHSRNHLTVHEVKAFELLPLSMMMQLQQEMCGPSLSTKAFFLFWEIIDVSGHAKLCHEAIRFWAMGCGDTIFIPGSANNEVYVLVEGTLLYNKDNLLGSMTAPGSFTTTFIDVVEGTWMCEAALWVDWTTIGKAEAKNKGEYMIIDVQEFLKHVTKDRYVARVAREYAIGYTARLRLAESLADDIQVENTEPIDIIIRTSSETQKFVSKATFEWYFDSWSIFSTLDHHHEQLRSEIDSGKCTLFTDCSRELIRGVSVGVLYLVNDNDQVLVQIGSWDGMQITGKMGLPGSVCRSGEKPREAVDRILEEELAPLKDDIEFEDRQSEEVDWGQPSRSKIRTKYWRTVHRARVLPSFTSDVLAFARVGVVNGMAEAFTHATSTTTHGSRSTAACSAASRRNHSTHTNQYQYGSERFGGSHGQSAKPNNCFGLCGGGKLKKKFVRRSNNAARSMSTTDMSSVASKHEVFRLQDSKGKSMLYAWLQESEFRQAKSVMRRSVSKYLSELDLQRCLSSDCNSAYMSNAQPRPSGVGSSSLPGSSPELSPIQSPRSPKSDTPSGRSVSIIHASE